MYTATGSMQSDSAETPPLKFAAFKSVWRGPWQESLKSQLAQQLEEEEEDAAPLTAHHQLPGTSAAPWSLDEITW